MARAYGWSFTDPMRKLAYNLTVTALSVVVALVVGTIVLTGLLRDQLGASTETLTSWLILIYVEPGLLWWFYSEQSGR